MEYIQLEKAEGHAQIYFKNLLSSFAMPISKMAECNLDSRDLNRANRSLSPLETTLSELKQNIGEADLNQDSSLVSEVEKPRRISKI